MVQLRHPVSWPQHYGYALSRQKVTVGVPEREGRRRIPRTICATIPHVSLLADVSVMTIIAGNMMDDTLTVVFT